MENSPSDFLLTHLQALKIEYTLHQHAPVFSMEDCLNLPFLEPDMIFPKNLLLETPTKDRRILLMMPPEKPFRTSVVSKLVHTSRLSFASPATMLQMLHTRPGALSPLGLFCEEAKGIALVLDCDIMTANRLCIHPCDPQQTVVLSMLDFLSSLIPSLGCPYTAIKIPWPEEELQSSRR